MSKRVPASGAARTLTLILAVAFLVTVTLVETWGAAASGAGAPGSGASEVGVSVPGASGGLPAPSGFVNDFAGVLSAAERQSLEEFCSSLEARTGAEMAIVTVRRTGDESIQMYAVRLFEAWGIGKKGRDNGVLILAAMEDRRVWVEVGYGLEGVLPDGKVGAILDRYLVPAFKEGRYGEGLSACARALAAEIGAAPAEEAERGPARPAPVSAVAFPVLFGLGMAAFVIFLVYVLARAGSPRCPSCHARLLVREKVVTPATMLATGTALVLYTCPRCGYRREKKRVLTRLVPVYGTGTSRRGGPFWGPFGGGGWSGRSGGKFGGFGRGRSGGGGAGRGW